VCVDSPEVSHSRSSLPWILNRHIAQTLELPRPDQGSTAMADLSNDLAYPRLGSGKPYHFFTPSISAALDERQKLVKAFNDVQGDSAAGAEAARRIFKSIGEKSVVAQPLWVEWVSPK